MWHCDGGVLCSWLGAVSWGGQGPSGGRGLEGWGEQRTLWCWRTVLWLLYRCLLSWVEIPGSDLTLVVPGGFFSWSTHFCLGRKISNICALTVSLGRTVTLPGERVYLYIASVLVWEYHGFCGSLCVFYQMQDCGIYRTKERCNYKQLSSVIWFLSASTPSPTPPK